ncbi:MAG TPA: WD40 repeat domain-containing protein [Terriglobales bacterium]|nr:WD40 repeat domain-containing protein [Terriglobales bacterium]
MRHISLSLAAVIVFVTLSFGEGTRTWEQSSFDDFEKGTATGVAIRNDGSLALAPSFKPLSTTPSTYIWAIDTDSDGNVYAASGSPARVYRIAKDGKANLIFAPHELQVQSLVVDPSGAIFAATSPDGKVYKIVHRKAGAAPTEETPAETEKTDRSQSASAPMPVDRSYSSSVYFNPETKYIWNLVLDKQGNLYVATGDRGQIFRVGKDGQHSVFFKSDEAHIRVMAFDPKGNLIAGSDGSGLVYRISPQGEAFVLYSAPKKEITALAVDSAGNIYAAGAGEKRAPSAAPGQMPVTGPVTTIGSLQGTISLGGASPSPTPVFSTAIFANTGGSEIYRIAPDGAPLRIWSSRDDLVYALAFDQHGTLLAGTGNKGRIYAISGDDVFADLLKASANQVTAFAKSPSGGLYASTSNFGKLFLLGPGPETQGSYESDVYDAKNFSQWGRAQMRASGSVDFFARSGNVDNPDRNWSPWQRLDPLKDVPVGVPSARFVQWKAVLHDGKTAPRLDSVVLNYLPKNVAPEIEEVGVQIGSRYQPTPKPVGASASGQGPQQFDSNPPPPIHDRGSIAVHWNSRDENDDQLIYSLYYRGDGDSRWLLLKDHVEDRFYSFDASLLPDGGYSIKVVASDAPSHSPNESLSAEKESPRFEVDTTPPAIQDLKAFYDGEQVRVSFRAVDGFSPIKRAEYSVDAQDWQYVEPVGQISDSRAENYDFIVSGAEAVAANVNAAPNKSSHGPRVATQLQFNGESQEHIIVVRAYDRFDNMGSAKFVLHPIAAAENDKSNPPNPNSPRIAKKQ